MNRYDPQGNPVSGCSAAALDGLAEASTLFHGYYTDPIARIARSTTGGTSRCTTWTATTASPR